jgi:hypothetical protein
MNGPALIQVAAAGHEQVADLLIARGAKIDISDIMGQTSLNVAIIDRQLKMAEFLIEKGADVNYRDKCAPGGGPDESLIRLGCAVTGGFSHDVRKPRAVICMTASALGPPAATRPGQTSYPGHPHARTVREWGGVAVRILVFGEVLCDLAATTHATHRATGCAGGAACIRMPVTLKSRSENTITNGVYWQYGRSIWPGEEIIAGSCGG